MALSSTRQLVIEDLEARNLLSVSSIWFSGNMLVVQTDDAATSIAVAKSGTNIQIRDTNSGQVWSYAASSVGSVEFQGGMGDDRFVNNVQTLKVRGFGGGGNDYLEGYDGADVFVGGAGDDTIKCYGGNDKAWGGPGNDTLLGMNGDDQLMGEDGDDHLNGGAGKDSMWGGAGDDVLIAIDSYYTDYLQPDAGRDTAWVDSSSSSSDRVYGAASEDKTQYVRSFKNGADRTLNGDRIADPKTTNGYTYRRFDNNPLFASAGPDYDDIDQGSVGDCWLLAGLAAIANDTPHTLKQYVVDFDDGTYGVRLGNNFYRVDNDLPVNSYGSLAYAKLGHQNSMWVAVVEKAYAHYRYGTNSYASIDGGWSVEVNRAFGAAVTGDRAIDSYASYTALGNEIYTQWNNYNSVTIGFLSARTSSANAPLVMMHMYTVISVERDSSGNVLSVTLRNPWGVDGAGNDGTDDGLVTVTPYQIYQYNGRINWGHV